MPQPTTPPQLPRRFELRLPEGHTIGTPVPIFRKMEDAELRAFKERFAGKKGAAPSATASAAAAGRGGKRTAASPSAPSPAPAPAAALPEGAVTMPCDLRVGVVLSAEDHPSADKLLVLKVDVGEQKPRQVVSGIKDRYSKEQLAGMRVVLVCNLKPSKLRDVVSEGMVLTGDVLDSAPTAGEAAAAAAGDVPNKTYVLCTPGDAAAAAAGSQVLGENVFLDPKLKKPIDAKAFSKVPLRIRGGVLCLGDTPLGALSPSGTVLSRIVAPGIADGKVK